LKHLSGYSLSVPSPGSDGRYSKPITLMQEVSKMEELLKAIQVYLLVMICQQGMLIGILFYISSKIPRKDK